MGSTGQKEEIHRHSGWLIPGVFFLVMLVLSGLLLGWYLRPGPRPVAAPTGRSTPVQLIVGGTSFAIPANYIEGRRSGGELDAVSLTALFPSWRGYSDADARLFTGNAPDSRVVRVSLRSDTSNLDAHERLERIYKPHIVNPQGDKAPFALTQYRFAADSGYEGNDLFAGETEKGLLLLLCERGGGEFSSPYCLAVDRPLTPKLSFSYRFKRAYLARWQEISTGVDALIVKFRAP